MTFHWFLHSIRRVGALLLCLHVCVCLLGQDAGGAWNEELKTTSSPVVTSLRELGLGEFPTVGVLSLADTNALSPPNGWTVQRIAWALAGAGLIGLSAVAWSVLLNRRVKQQTSALRQTLEQERLMEERYRKIFESALDMIRQ